MNKKPGRLLTAMVTPFKEDGEVDFEQAKKLALALLASGSDGLVVVGTTGESPTLVRKEELQLFRDIKAVGDKGWVIAGTGSNSTQEAIEATQQAEECGVDACLLVVPYYTQTDTGRLVPAFQGHCRKHQTALHPL
jgi:4-hydroxy-tetrahydrodipicolinate synthase